MNDFVNDTWQELREKRLWPIALLLLLAIVAVPALLTKSAAQPPATEAALTAPSDDERVSVRLDDGPPASTGAGSSLDGFAQGDPFTPPAAIARNGGGATGTATIASSSEPDAADGGAGTGGDGGSPPSQTPAAPRDIAPPQTRTETAEYEYIADVTLWTGERRRKIKGLRKLHMLPSQTAPVLIFMGTANGAGDAVFLVDSTLAAAGEGRCVPSPANCAYVHIGPGAEHAFTSEAGDSYRLRVDEIRRVATSSAAASRRRPTAGASGGANESVRRFELPSLVDLVAITETTTTQPAAAAPAPGSSVAADGR
jgi:hypothetical protein